MFNHPNRRGPRSRGSTAIDYDPARGRVEESGVPTMLTRVS
ncbi:hypothetical protein RSSM_05610 [Rhodopirellula sallentina SM41]|uniref:Uncharacterized protein n=1 Tax=Rhodopirellula sallentina SM41 TaxID=1263870 RepID=M5U507_9BACT|nr:hypothetical protein RSSM_05610 [Rhodopirellula sallentina SM41]